MDKMDVYRKRLEGQLKEWKALIEMLEDKAAKATGATKTELTGAIEELRGKKDVVKRKVAELQKESGIAWETMKEGLEKSVADLKSTLDKVISRFK